jgi:hypothetical protein
MIDYFPLQLRPEKFPEGGEIRSSLPLSRLISLLRAGRRMRPFALRTATFASASLNVKTCAMFQTAFLSCSE